MALTEEFVRHVVRKGRGRDRLAAELIPTLVDPDEVWLQAELDPNTGKRSVRYMPVYFRSSSGSTIAVAWEQRDGSLGLTFYPATDRQLNKRRRGYLLYRRP